MIPLRICITGGTFGPDLTKICELIGRDETVARIRKGIQVND